MDSSLTPPWIPMGQALLDYHNGQRAAFITVRSSIEKDRDVPVDAFYKQGLRFPRLEKKALNACRGTVLDIGAGAGAHSLWLQKKGMKVTALDINPLAADVMIKRGVKDVKCADIFNCRTNEKYDTLLLMMNGIGLCGDLPGLEIFLKKGREMMTRKGQIIFDSTDISYVLPEDKALAKLPSPVLSFGSIVQYQLIYKEYFSKPYNWLFLDKVTLLSMAARQGYAAEIIQEEEDQFLARLNLQ